MTKRIITIKYALSHRPLVMDTSRVVTVASKIFLAGPKIALHLWQLEPACKVDHSVLTNRP
jgi:hypothetical protein